MKILTSFAIATIAAMLIGLPASVVAAGNETTTHHVLTQVVALGDLNLSNQDDAQELLQRLQIAARNSCKRTYWTRDRDPFHIDRKNCQHTAYRNSVTEINSRFNIHVEQIAGVTNELAATE